uniref:Uncharacterized protein n=1 Tax=Lepeophtheirus salmonis TaxID=72036 RepID=A0A0K2U009_LEPSM
MAFFFLSMEIFLFIIFLLKILPFGFTLDRRSATLEISPGPKCVTLALSFVLPIPDRSFFSTVFTGYNLPLHEGPKPFSGFHPFFNMSSYPLLFSEIP